MELLIYREKGGKKPERIEVHPLSDVLLEYSTATEPVRIHLNDRERGLVTKVELTGDREPPPPPDPIEYREHVVRMRDLSPYAKEPDKVLTTLRLRK